MRRKLDDSVVVITGASSGIGRATALRFAREGATVVLAARNAEALREVASECERLGARALAVPTDVTDEESVEALARAAIENLGRIDVWVNNAAVTLFSRFEEAPPEDWRRVIETNLFGYVHGARAAIPWFREQGQGLLINNLTGFAMGGAPYLSAYVASKFALRGLTECLRQELRGEGIEVCAVLPASVDTPLFQHAANYTGRALQPLRPVLPPQRVARAIVRLARRPRRELLVGRSSRSLRLLHSLARPLYDSVIQRRIERKQFQARSAEPSAGNLWHPLAEGTEASGGWGREGGRRASRALLGTGVVALLGLGWLGLREAGRWA